MSDTQPVAYPSLGAAYPVKNAAYPVAPPVPAFKRAEVEVEGDVEAQAQFQSQTQSHSRAQTAVADTPVEVTAPQKFFPLVPTTTSMFVSNDIVEIAVDPEVENAPPAEIEIEAKTEVEPEAEAEIQVKVEPDAENLFDISPSLTREPQTNSIVLESIPDVLTSSEAFSEAGEILVTGSIELPTITGEVSLANESPEADVSDSLDSASVTISTVAPVRAPSVVNSKAQLGVLPSKRRRSQGQLMAMLTLGLLIVTVGTLYVMAAIVGIIK